MLASIETFVIFLLIAGGSALFNWLKKRGEISEDGIGELPRQTPPPISNRDRHAPPPLPQQRKTTDWEEELRRMLEGTATPPPPQRMPPPIVVQERIPPPVATRPAPAQPTPVRAKTSEEKYYKAHCNHCGEHMEFPSSAMGEQILCPHCNRPTVLNPFQDTTVEVLSHQKHLSSLSEKVAAHMGDVGHHRPVAPPVVLKKTQVWPEVAETVALFKNAKTVRQAVIASLILGPPKAFED